MIELRILQLAKRGALEKWAQANEALKKIPDNKLAQKREGKAWEELMEIEEMLKKYEKSL